MKKEAKTKLTLAFILILISLAINTNAQLNPYKYSQSITCGNSLCEASSLELKIGEEKSIFMGRQSYAFKLVNIEKIENPYLNYNFYLSINNGPSMLADEAEKNSGISFSCCALIGMQEEGQGVSNPTGVQINFAEAEICSVPDCAFQVELNIYKKWNLVPLHIVNNVLALKEGNCQIEDFKVIYSYNPLQNNYAKLYSFGDSARDFELAVDNFQNNFQSERLLVSSPFNSVWVYSNKECKIAAETPKLFENFLIILKQLTEQTILRPYLPGEAPTSPETITTTFAPGWNYFMGSSDMQGKSFDEIKGSCSIEKAYTFDASTQSWKQLSTAPGIIDSLLLKVANKCMIGLPEVAPPEIPT